MEPVREILRVKVDPNRNPTQIIKTMRGELPGFPADTAIFHPEGMVAVEDFKAGDTVRWNFSHAEVQYILKGN